ncbi:hypothetical protein [Lactococcus garvieae]|uniref:hypothetical protein n=3 Tax=Lactococcus garvieae TaxID=1363 RepID=UPI00255056EF|nr:hypothetical protein [Lactococcus garvieae]
MEQIFDITQQFSSQMLANRRYIKSIKEIMGTTFKLNIELSTEEETVFKLFNLLNDMYVDLRSNPTNFLDKLKSLDSDFSKTILESETEPKEIFDAILKHFSKTNDGKKGINFSIDEESDTVVLVIEDRDMRSNIKLYQDEQLKRIEQARLLNETSLITISNTFESLISNLISILVIKDKTVKIQDKTLTFKQIEELGGLEEAKDYLIEKTVEDIMRGSQSHWLKYIGKNTAKSFFDELEGEEEEKFIDFFLKRNLIIHSNSKINKKYLTSCKKQYSEEQKQNLIGKRIAVNEEYLLENLKLIYVMGLKSSYYVAKKNFSKNIKAISESFQILAYENLEIEEYQVAYEIYNLLWKDKENLTASAKMLLCINYMQSLKWTGKTKELEKLLKEEDFSLADNLHRMCINILEDNFEAAVREFEEVLKSKNDDHISEISMINHFISWPIFKEFLKTPEYNAFMTEKGYTELKIVDEVVD